MSRLISDKYREAQRQYLERFNQLKANEEELNRIFIDIYGLQEELTPDVADKDVTVYRIIDEPSDEERKMRYVLSMRDEIVSLLSYIVGCILGRYSPYVDGLLFAGGEWDDAQIRARIEEGAKACDFADPSLGLSTRTATALCRSPTRRISRMISRSAPSSLSGRSTARKRWKKTFVCRVRPRRQGRNPARGHPQLLPERFLRRPPQNLSKAADLLALRQRQGGGIPRAVLSAPL